jgi:hypothetical protein
MAFGVTVHGSILVHGNVSRHQGRVATIVSRHQGRVATIATVGYRRLTVRFDDNQPGSFIDYKVALLLPPRGITSYAPNEYDLLRTDNDGHVTPLEQNRILAHFTRALATAIAQEYDDEMAMESLIDHFTFELRCDVASQAQDRREQDAAGRDR